MSTVIENWKQAVGTTAELRCMAGPGTGPMLAYTGLNLPAHVQADIDSWTTADFTTTAQRERGLRSSMFVIDGFYKDPACSAEAQAQLADTLRRAFPPTPHRNELAEALSERFTQLASAWNRRTLAFDLRGEHHPKAKGVAHVDFDSEFVAFAYLRNHSTLFANPASYYGVLPNSYVHEGTGRRIIEYPLTPQLRAGLEELPAQSIAAWRGGAEGAVHVTPDFTGPRMVLMAQTVGHRNAAALL